MNLEQKVYDKEIKCHSRWKRDRYQKHKSINYLEVWSEVRGVNLLKRLMIKTV